MSDDEDHLRLTELLIREGYATTMWRAWLWVRAVEAAIESGAIPPAVKWFEQRRGQTSGEG